MSTTTISLKDKSGLVSKGYTIYVMGFSSTSCMQLGLKSGTTAEFQAITDSSGDLNAFALSSTNVGSYTGITEISIDKSVEVKGARIYFFFSKNSKFATPPTISYTQNGASVVNVPNPPNTDYAPYTFAEFTNDPSYGAVIDSQTVDGFTAPMTIEIFDDKTSKGKVGNDLSLTRSNVIAAYAPFINALSDATASQFLELSYSTNDGGLLNPGAYLGDVSSTGQFNHIESSLNTLFDDELNTFFGTDAHGIKGSSSGTIPEQVYTCSKVTKNLPGTNFSHDALEFSNGSDVFDVFNPVGVCVMADGGKALLGEIDGLTLTFETPLSKAAIVEGMAMSGTGIPANQVTVKKVNKSGEKITSVDMDFDWGTLPPDSSYSFTTSGGTKTKYTASIVETTLTFKTPVPKADASNVAVGSTVVGAGISGDITIASLTTGTGGEITGATLNMSLGKTGTSSQYYFSKLPGMFLTTGNMVFANQGLFAYTGQLTDKHQKAVQLNIQNQIVTAFNRGVANKAPSSGTKGYTSDYWGTESNWYPEGVNQNLFSLFMHTGKYSYPSATQDAADDIKVPVFLQSSDSMDCARSTKMGQAYGFAYDENPMFVSGQGPVPSKFDPVPTSTTKIEVTLGSWT